MKPARAVLMDADVVFTMCRAVSSSVSQTVVTSSASNPTSLAAARAVSRRPHG